MPTLTINGRQVTVEKGTNLVLAASSVGMEIPHYCYHPALTIPASCRMCFVEITQEVRGKQQTKLQTACNTPAADGMIVNTETDAVKKAQNDVLEFLLLNHPVDCPVCDKAGECRLQDFTFTYGNRYSRFTEPKRFKHAKKLGSGIRLFTNRCILCDRCVRFLRDFVGTSELSVVNMGHANEISTFPGKPIDNKLATNITDLCPVGALISEDTLFKARAWNLKPLPSICPGCARGCNEYLDVWHNEVQRTRPRDNRDVNGYFLCDPGRFTYHVIRHPDRIESAIRRNGPALVEIDWSSAVAEAADTLAAAGNGAVILVSTHLTIEDMEAAKAFAETLGATLAFIPNADRWERVQYPGGFIIEADKSPNTAGAERVVGRSIDDVTIDGTTPFVLVINSSVNPANIGPAHLGKIRGARAVVAVDVVRSPLVNAADITLPGRMWAEKEGVFVNSQGHEQRFVPAVLGPVQSRDERDIIRELARRIAEAAPAAVAGVRT